MRKSLLFIVVLLAISSCMTHQFSTVSVDTGAIPEEDSFLLELILERVDERVPAPDRTHPVLEVIFRTDPTLPGEDAVVTVRGGRVTVSASGTRGFVFGAGKFLRSLRYTCDGIVARDGEYRFSPKSDIRCCYTARHHNNWYHWATAEELTRYFDDMMLWGMNSFRFQLLYPGINRVGAAPEDVLFFESNSKVLADRIAQLGMTMMGPGGSNVTDDNMPKEFKATPLKPRRGNDRWNVCPSKPGATEYLLDYKLRKLQELKERGYEFDYLCFFPYDEGGCQCEECSPWGGNGYVKLIEKMFRLDREYYPDAKSIVSCWYFDEKDWEAFYKYLENQNWIDYLEIDSHGDFPRYPLEHKITGNIPVVTFPEISMWGRFPWGGYGATALPGRFERLYRQVQDIAKGFRLYSEGLYEDINKIVVTELYVDPSRHADDILEEYANYEFPGIKPRDFKKFIHLLEETHLCGEADSTRKADFNPSRFMREYPEHVLAERQAKAVQAYELAMKMDAQILPSMKDCWRWQLFKARAIIDKEMFSARSIHTPVSDEWYAKLVKIYHAERQMRRMEVEGLGGATAVPYLQPQVQ